MIFMGTFPVQKYDLLILLVLGRGAVSGPRRRSG